MTLKELLTIIVVVPTFLFLSNFLPQIQPLFMTTWIFCLGFDVYSTYQFYLESPGQFPKNERNKLFVWLTKKVGFKKATILFPIAIEIPLLLFFAFLPLQTLHIHMLPNTPNNLITCITASFGISAIGHLQAAITNTKHNNKTTRCTQLDQDDTKNVSSCPNYVHLTDNTPSNHKTLVA